MTERTTVAELRDLVLALCDEAVRVGCADWYIAHTAREVRALPDSPVVYAHARATFRRAIVAVDTCAEGLPGSSAFREVRAAVEEVWKQLDAEWRLAGVGE